MHFLVSQLKLLDFVGQLGDLLVKILLLFHPLLLLVHEQADPLLPELILFSPLGQLRLMEAVEKAFGIVGVRWLSHGLLFSQEERAADFQRPTVRRRSALVGIAVKCTTLKLFQVLGVRITLFEVH